MKNRINEVLDVLADYPYINIDKFYNDKSNQELLDAFENDETWAMQELYEAIDDFIKFETNYNSDIGSF
jgi:hypothetical protein